MLSPDQIIKLRGQAGLSPVIPAPVASGANDILNQRKAALGINTAPPTPERQNPVMDMLNTMSDTLVNQGQEAVKNVSIAFSPNRVTPNDYGDNIGNATADLAKRLASLGHASMDVGAMALSPMGAFISSIVPKATKEGYDQSINWIADHITNNPIAQDFLNKTNDFFDANPDAKEALLHDLPTVVQLVSMSKGPLNPDVSLDSLKSTLSDTTNSFINAWNKVTDITPGDVSRGANNLIPHPFSGDNGLLRGVKENLSAKNATPQLETSAGRIENPLETYNKYLDQAKATKVDVTKDPPLSQVGSDIGDSYKKVIDMRREVGATMGKELKNIGDVETDIGDNLSNLKSNLTENGLKYNLIEGKVEPTGQTSMSSFDQKLLTNYYNALDKLGPNPTIAELDSFMKRIPSELNVAKASANITDVTNAERLVKGSLSDLRDQFNPESTGNPALQNYFNARQQYAELSNFLDEGSKFLGKLTQSGDYARDTSLAKSSVQSLLNGGKKDWLAQLQDYTGDPVLDKSVVALQAMKDVGDARGTSLLQTLADNPPKSASGLLSRMADWSIGKAKDIFVGSPEEQTRTFLQSLESNANQINNGINTNANIPAQNGDITNSIKNNNTASIPPNDTTPPINMQAGFVKNPLGLDPTEMVDNTPDDETKPFGNEPSPQTVQNINAQNNSPEGTGMKFIGTRQDLQASNIIDQVQNHLDSAKQILDNTPKVELNNMGGMRTLLDRTKINIVDSLANIGQTDLATQINNINTSLFNSIDSLGKAIKIIVQTHTK